MIKKANGIWIYIGNPESEKKLKSGICIYGEESRLDNLLRNIYHQISNFLAWSAKKINYTWHVLTPGSVTLINNGDAPTKTFSNEKISIFRWRNWRDLNLGQYYSKHDSKISCYLQTVSDPWWDKELVPNYVQAQCLVQLTCFLIVRLSQWRKYTSIYILIQECCWVALALYHVGFISIQTKWIPLSLGAEYVHRLS